MLLPILVALFILLLPGSAFAADGMYSIGDFRSLERTPDGCVINCADKSQVRLQVLAPDMVRVRAAFQKAIPQVDHSWAIDKTNWNVVPIKITENATNVVLETDELRVQIDRAPLKVAFFDSHNGRLINSDALPMIYDLSTGEVVATKKLGFEEHFYGLGEKAARLDKRREAFQMWSSDTPAYTLGTDPIYQSIPFYIGLSMDRNAQSEWQGSAYGVFFDNSHRTHFDFAAANSERVMFSADGGEMNYYFFYGPSIKKVVNRYTELTGRMPLPPKWALGNQQCRWSYSNEQQVRDVVSRYRQEKIPLDCIHLDIDYMDGYRDFTFSPERFPDPKGLIKWLGAQGVKTVTIIDPGVKYEPGGKYNVFNEGTARNYFLKKTDGKTYVGKVWPGESVFVDYTLPDAAKWWGDLHRPLLDLGVAGIWNDMNEPADFESRDGDKWKNVVNYDQGQNSRHAKMRNLFALLECKATYEGLARLRPQERPYIITRSGYAGIQRYATMWTGDNNSTWDSMALSVPMFQSLGLSGEAFVGADCGGFMGRSDGELLARWYQIGFLSPFFRNHHAMGNYDQEPWRFGTRYEDVIRKYVQLRYRLIPYLYTVLAEAHETGVPWFRPLIMEFQNDYNVVNIDDEFMVGSSLLCAPVLRPGVTSRDLYLPPGDWYNFFSGEKVSGGRFITVSAPLDTVPLFVKAGTVLPIGPVMDYLGQAADANPGYRIFPDNSGRAEGSLYLDDGKSTAYKNGDCEHLSLSFNDGKLLIKSDKNVGTAERLMKNAELIMGE